MTLTVRSSSLTGATTAARALTHAEMDANWAHVIESSNQNFTPSGIATSGNRASRSMQDKAGDILSLKDAKNDNGTAVGAGNDDVTAIQELVDSVKGTVDFLYEDPDSGQEIFVPNGTYEIATPITVYSGTRIRFEGPAAKIVCKAGFTGDAAFLLDSIDGGGWVGGIHMLGQGTIEVPSGSSAWCISNATSEKLVNCRFDLRLDGPWGFRSQTYTQDCDINLYVTGPTEQAAFIKGNANKIRIDREDGSAGATADPYVLLDDHAISGGHSTANELDMILEGFTFASKTPVKVVGGSFTNINRLWIEGSAAPTYGLEIEDCNGPVRLLGFIHLNTEKIKVTNSVLEIDTIQLEIGSDKGITDLIEADAFSFVKINYVQSTTSEDVRPVDGVIQVRDEWTRALAAEVEAGTVDGWRASTSAIDVSPHNLLVNPSFEAGEYAWNKPANTTFAVEASEVAPGLMAKYTFSTTGNFTTWQNITVPAAWVGRPITFAAKVKVVTAGAAAITFAGADVTSSGTYGQATAGSGWQWLVRTITPLAAGTLQPGIICVSMTTSSEVYVDEFYAGFGKAGVSNPAKFGSFELGTAAAGKTFASGSAAPTDGTWKRGDIVFNNAPAAAGTIGWVCVTAGTPGTWKTWGDIAS
jgi:hypothetical protein